MSPITITFQPSGTVVEAKEGSSLLEVARRAGFSLLSECGGQGTCGRCKVKLLSGGVFMTEALDLSLEEKQKGFTLACIARIQEDLIVEIPLESELHFENINPKASDSVREDLKQVLSDHGLEFDPLVRFQNLVIPFPTIKDNSSDFERLRTALNLSNNHNLEAPISVLRTLSDTLRESNGRVEALSLFKDSTCSLIELNTSPDQLYYGLALDVGTTTIQAKLIDIKSGNVVVEAGEFNRQISCGGDIIRRIVYAGMTDGLEKLRKLALQTCETLLFDLLSQVNGTSDQVVIVMVAGNTTMEHIFLGLNPQTIRLEPYVPTITTFPVFNARDIDLPIHAEAPTFISPSVASYVGGDITAGILAAGIHRSVKLTLYVDLGTNGEIVLGNKDWLTACACSAGPAFEGSGVKCGMRAIPGAIDQVKSSADGLGLNFRVIGGGTPCGICGSGLIDLLAKLRSTGRIDPKGKLKLDVDPKRIRSNGRKSEILLIDSTETGNGDIVVTDVDLDNLIRTKGAIFAGIQTLLKGVGLSADEIERVIIAGGFGKYLDIENAIRIGMLPDLPRDRYEYIGNGSLLGAELALLSRQGWRELHEIAGKVTYFELSSWPGYMDDFMAALFLPHTDATLFPSVK
jgi:uncharacterized 2Fe-2S/4Fe-4S cluster protein (DUF4445 family)